jgi:hypothetical protein
VYRGSSRRISFLVLAAILSAPGPAHSQSENQERSRITDRQKGESTAKKIARFPIRLALFPLRLVDLGLEYGMLAVDEKNLIPRTQHYYQQLVNKGLYVKIGGAGDGAGFGGGVAWKMSSGTVSPTLATSGSIKGYQDHSFTLDFSKAFQDKLDVAAQVRYRKRPEEDFFGIGPTTRGADRTTYNLEQTDASLRFGKALSKPVRFDAEIAYAKSNVFRGKDDLFPSTEDLFPESLVPGLEEGAELVSGDLFLLFDFRRRGCERLGPLALRRRAPGISSASGKRQPVRSSQCSRPARSRRVQRGSRQGNHPLLPDATPRRQRHAPRFSRVPLSGSQHVRRERGVPVADPEPAPGGALLR